MRSLAIAALLACSLGLALAAPPGTPLPDGLPNTPADGVTGDPYCTLQSLDFTNNLFLLSDFRSNVYNYECSCLELQAPFTTIATPRMNDSYASAEVAINGQWVHSKQLGNAISNKGLAPHSPLLQSGPLQFVTGMNEIIIGVSCNLNANPPCYYEYRITCEMPDDGGFIVGDPQFVGLRGQQYQVHGVSGEIYNIVSDPDLQYNSRFVFLDQGECPVVNGKKQKGCFSHPGSYLGEIGIKTRSGDRIHLQTGSAKHGFEAVLVNGRPLDVDETVLLADDMGSVSRNSTHLATVSVGNWEFAFENSDMFVNQRVRVRDARKLRSHGLLGQTWRDATYPNAIKYIAGTVDDYVIREKDIFGDSFVYNAFN